MSKIISDKEQLNQQQKEAVERSINEFTKIIAGAGTGKTKIISKRFHKLVCDLKNQGVELPQERLLVITFTEKASAEMKDRILKELKNNNIINAGEDFSISTIHGFCSKFLRKHSIEANLSPKFELINEKQQQEIYQNIIDKIKFAETSEILFIDDVLKELNLPTNILNIENILNLKKITSLNNLFEDIFNLIKQIKSLGMTPNDFMNNSINSIIKFQQVLKNIPFNLKDRNAYENAWENHLKHFADSSCSFTKDVFENLFSDKVILDKNNGKGKHACLKWAPPINFFETIDETTELEIYLTKIIAIIYGAYSKILESLDLVDFDDLINKTLYILENNTVIRNYYQKFYKHIIVDEFQDTSTAQMRLLLSLLNEKYPNLTIVGDRKQSIYSFRYAQVENVDIIQKIIEKKYAQKYTPIQLINNYRSIPQVLEIVNSVTQNQLNLEEILLPNPTQKFEHIENAIKISKLTNIDCTQEHKIKEAWYIAQEILTTQEKHNLKFKDFAILVRGHSQADIIEEQLNLFGIPVSKKINSNYFEKTIVKNIIAIFEFLKNVRNELALVKILEIKFSQREIYSLKKDIDTCFSELTEKDDFYKFNFAEKVLFLFENNYLDKSNIQQPIINYFQKFYSLVSQFQKETKSLSIQTLFYKLVQNIDFIYPQNIQEMNDSKINTKIFEKILIDYVKQAPYVTISTFLEYIEEIKKDKNFELPQIISSEIDAVQILTIHASKGLEYPYVFLAGIAKEKPKEKTSITCELKYDSDFNFGLIIKKYNNKETPKNRIYKSISQYPKNESENLRLFYVALTRAKTFLNVLSFDSYSKKTTDYFSNLENDFPNLIQQIDVKTLEIKKRNLPQITCLKEDYFIAPKLAQEKKEKLSLSFSKINLFNKCNQMYYLKYVLGYPSLQSNESHSLVGNIIHNLIATFYLNNQTLTEMQLDNILKTLEIDNNKFQEIKTMYSLFINSEFTKLNDVLSEFSFNFQYKNVNFKGDIDLLKKNSDGSYDIYDFKTNKDIQNSLQNYHKQMLIYKLAMVNIGLKINNLKLVNIKKNELLIFEISENNLKQAEKSLILDIEEIENLHKNSYGKISILKKEKTCQTCDFSYICPMLI